MGLTFGFIGCDTQTVDMLRFFSTLPDITVAVVADVTRDTPAMIFASQNGIHMTTNVMEAATTYKLDILFHVSAMDSISSASIATALSDEAIYFNPATTKVMLKTVATILSTEYIRLEQQFVSNIREISQALNEFATITKNIDILAINASIEAARAGETGKGFSVVATNIKDLVKHSKQNFTNIRRALRELEQVGDNLALTSKILKLQNKE
ncbi:hypothetical protein KAH37_01620 [bacterium]|nr:hypothetical protein [bacterium]